MALVRVGALAAGNLGRTPSVRYPEGYYLYIHGGNIVVDAVGDGIDVNGAMEMTGGVVLVNGPTNDGNGALDEDAGAT